MVEIDVFPTRESTKTKAFAVKQSHASNQSLHSVMVIRPKSSTVSSSSYTCNVALHAASLASITASHDSAHLNTAPPFHHRYNHPCTRFSRTDSHWDRSRVRAHRWRVTIGVYCRQTEARGKRDASGHGGLVILAFDLRLTESL